VSAKYANTYLEVKTRDEVLLIFHHPSYRSTHGQLHIWVNPYDSIPVNTVFQIGGMLALSALRKMKELGITKTLGRPYTEDDWNSQMYPDHRFEHESVTGVMALVPPERSSIGRRQFTDLCKESALESIERYNLLSWRVFSVHGNV
jgi:hypothetical protein